MADSGLLGERVDIGHGMFYSKCVFRGDWVGIYEWHRCGARDVPGLHGDGTTAFWVPFDVPAADAVTTGLGPRWELVQEEPLTLAPSILCRACGNHGFIQAGRWVPA
jgi:hypothetical protein